MPLSTIIYLIGYVRACKGIILDKVRVYKGWPTRHKTDAPVCGLGWDSNRGILNSSSVEGLLDVWHLHRLEYKRNLMWTLAALLHWHWSRTSADPLRRVRTIVTTPTKEITPATRLPAAAASCRRWFDRRPWRLQAWRPRPRPRSPGSPDPEQTQTTKIHKKTPKEP